VNSASQNGQHNAVDHSYIHVITVIIHLPL